MKFKKILSALVAGAMAVTAFMGAMPGIAPEISESIEVRAVNTDTSGTYGDNLTWEQDSEGVLTISGSGDMNITFSDNTDIKRVVISEGITSICDSAFSGCSRITSVIIPKSVESVGSGAFDGTEVLHYQMRNNMGPLYYVDNWLIYSDRKINKVSGSNAIKSGTIGIASGAFNGSKKLNNIEIPVSVLYINDEAFMNCPELTSITINNPNCKIYDDRDTISGAAVIRGHKNSTAQAYAEKWGHRFEAIETEPSKTTIDQEDSPYVFVYSMVDGGAIITGFKSQYQNLSELTIPEKTEAGIPVIGISDLAFADYNINKFICPAILKKRSNWGSGFFK